MTWDRFVVGRDKQFLVSNPPRPVPARASGRPHSTGPSPPAPDPPQPVPARPFRGRPVPVHRYPVPARCCVSARTGPERPISWADVRAGWLALRNPIRQPTQGVDQPTRAASRPPTTRGRGGEPPDHEREPAAPANLCRVPGKPQRVRGKPQRVRGKPQREPGKPVWPVVSPMTHRNQPSHHLADQRAEKAQREGYPLKSPQTPRAEEPLHPAKMTREAPRAPSRSDGRGEASSTVWWLPMRIVRRPRR